ncbi:Phosphatidylinositol kinase family-like protein [Zostera marina]|uniref:1-phosphatidylinositol 4-kinase n=1 Tax=Zostera marina TaxID=29655 RepID=A0A0K9NJ50_ZOSMR|nr:Phosphatidylinositol kinase family-like protein [Zostera marina]
MSPNLDSLAKTPMAVAVFKNSTLALGSEFHRSKTDTKPGGSRRVFVQTEAGCVLGIELERGDNVHTVKRRLQLALNVPTDESSLTFGDVVLKNDLRSVRKDSPLLLKRNIIHRSSSTPCLSPRGTDLQLHDWSGPVEILGCPTRCSQTKQLVSDVVKAIRNGVEPNPVTGGLGGAYLFKNNRGEEMAIVKPTDEEPFAPNNPKGFVGKLLGQPGLKRSVRVGETGFREVAAYLLDYDHFANVPPTVLVKITHSIFNVNGVNGCSNRSHERNPEATVSKIASLQQFVKHDFDASDYGTSSFPVSAVHRIGILDIRILNTDRHGGNLLLKKLDDDGVRKFGGHRLELIPIDHGLCLPESLEDPYFEWIHWPQASIPFSEDELEYIANLDPIRDSDMLRKELPMIREACLRVLILCTIFLKEAVGYGLCLAEIGEMMSREFKKMEEEPSELEIICMEARRLVEDREEQLFEGQCDDEEEEIQFILDCEEDDYLMHTTSPSSNLGFKGGIGRNPLSKLDESVENEVEIENEEEEEEYAVDPPPLTISNLSMSLQRFQLGKRDHSSKSKLSKGGINGSGGFQGGGNSRSANEQLQSGANFVIVADMGNEKWNDFLEMFCQLLPNAFDKHECGGSISQRQRLGTSCQF